MGSYLPWNGAAPINFYLKKSGLVNHSWQLRWKPVCASTEIELSRWLKSNRLLKNNSRAFFSCKQKYGTGQRGRVWESAKGGIWMSVAMNCYKQTFSTGLLGLAVAASLANRLEKNSIPVKIKWPNDLLVGEKKIAGFLPRIVYRGNNPILIRLGIGLNVLNRVPKEGISLVSVLEGQNISINHWSQEVLLAIEKAILLLESPTFLCQEGERLLWANKVKKTYSNELWDIEGFDLDGQLKVKRNHIKETWSRWE